MNILNLKHTDVFNDNQDCDWIIDGEIQIFGFRLNVLRKSESTEFLECEVIAR